MLVYYYLQQQQELYKLCDFADGKKATVNLNYTSDTTSLKEALIQSEIKTIITSKIYRKIRIKSNKFKRF